MTADRDPQTNLPNRASFQLAVLHQVVGSGGDRLALVVLADIDGFRDVNRQNGYAAGDALLVDLVEAWGRVLQASPGALLARTGGGSFGFLVPHFDPDEVADFVEGLRAAVPAPLTVTFGMALADDRDKLDGPILRAEKSLLKAKKVRAVAG